MAKQFVKPEIIAPIFGVSVRRVQQLTQEGIIHTEKVEGQRARQYDLIPTIQEYISYLSNKAAGKEATDKEKDLKEQKLEAEIALKESQAELHQMKTEVASGSLIHVDDVRVDYERFFISLKRYILGIPARVSGMISGYADVLAVHRIESELTKELTDSLRNFVAAGVTPEEEALLDASKAKKKKPAANKKV